MLAHELYRRAMATLAEAEALHVHSRSIHYVSQDQHPQCAIIRRCVHFRAPDRISSTFFGCNPVAVPERSDLIQVGDRAFHRQPTTTDGEWKEIEPALTSADDLVALIAGWMSVPSTDPSAGGVFSTTAFLLPTSSRIVLDGQAHQAILLPVAIQWHPRLYFPGDPVPRGGRNASFMYRGEYLCPQRTLNEGTLFVDARTARPLRYVAAGIAILDDGVTVIVSRDHVRFWYTSHAVIELPDLVRQNR